MEDDSLFQSHRSATTPSTPAPRRQRSLPPSLPSFDTSLLFHRTLHSRISNKHHGITRAKVKVAIELEFREERLREASARGDCNTVIKLLSTTPQPDINSADEKGRTPLHFACAGGHNDCVKLLIERGANVNAEADIAGNRPLHLAVISNKMDCVIALLEAGAKINMDDAFHRTPLSVARSRLNILMKNIESANVDVEEMVEDNENIPENREIFIQVLQIIKILRHYLSIENREYNNIQDIKNIKNNAGSANAAFTDGNEPMTISNTGSATSAMEALDDLTSQLSQMAISTTKFENSNSNSSSVNQYTLPDSIVLNKVQNVLDNIIKYQT
ncbi:ankyrin repeat domain-containing protein 54 [Gigaspora margarita]|uniref:Ankyrin repeat domain-containing protein 54 n=1 Tax=Gigaspora margarita TaxID=4874 RepID=A0A8H4EJ85_GIGMA|nr:ankyrin repeat domain-containing protein 54 [Gigaspora margarita]